MAAWLRITLGGVFYFYFVFKETVTPVSSTSVIKKKKKKSGSESLWEIQHFGHFSYIHGDHNIWSVRFFETGLVFSKHDYQPARVETNVL